MSISIHRSISSTTTPAAAEVSGDAKYWMLGWPWITEEKIKITKQKNEDLSEDVIVGFEEVSDEDIIKTYAEQIKNTAPKLIGKPQQHDVYETDITNLRINDKSKSNLCTMRARAEIRLMVYRPIVVGNRKSEENPIKIRAESLK